MDIEKVLAEYDAMFGERELKEIEEFLVKKIKEAKENKDNASLFTLLNESIGFYRDTTQKEKSLRDCEALKQLLVEMNLEGRVEYATSLLNIANAYRAFGEYEESLRLHTKVEEIYKKYIKAQDGSYASLYNNWSLLYQEMGDFSNAKDKLMQALHIIDLYPEEKIKQATTRTNLAMTLLKLNGKEHYDMAIQYLNEALEVFEADGGRDFHYGAALVAMGDAKAAVQSFQEAAKYYEKGMLELEKHVGKTQNYERVKEKYEYALKMKSQETLQEEDEINSKLKKKINLKEMEETNSPKDLYMNLQKKQKKNDYKETDTILKTNIESNLERCHKFYKTYGAKMIHEKFPEYEERIAVGMVGEGSDCFGYEDEISKDHDYELGFCMWLCKKDYKKIGASLQEEYEQLMQSFESNQSKNIFLKQRRGVMKISDFYNRILQTENDYEATWDIDYTLVSEENLATAVNGMVFRDDLGLFLKIRKKLLEYYPDEVFRSKLAQELHEFSQYAQSNYPRMMARKDAVTANLCISKAIESAMDLTFLLNRTYAPYYKWKKKALTTLKNLQEIGDLIDNIALLEHQAAAWEDVTYDASLINNKDRCVFYFEEIAKKIRDELFAQGLINGRDTFLENYCKELMIKARIQKENKEEKMERITKIITEIIKLEWEQFDKVKNEGGRAECQDDWNTFSLMRKSQYMAWTEELLESYYADLRKAHKGGWNLITEKYARMMKTTAPKQYAELEHELPVLSYDRIEIQEEIVKIQVRWMEEFAKQYPKMAGNARVIYTKEDTPYQTSYETYLRGELGTYSEWTFILYGRYIADLLKKGKNLAYEIMNHTAKLYGYESVEDAENQLQARRM